MNADSYDYEYALECALEKITKLREQVSEIAAAKHMQREVDRVLVENHKLREQVEAQAAVIELYEQALIASWPEGAMGDAFDYWNQARAATTDSTQILDEVRRAERERVAQFVDDNCTYGDTHILVKAIRAME